MILPAPYLPFQPKRIISLVPSQTELLWDLGLDEEVIAITKFCKHPVNWYKHKIKVGGTKTLNIPLIRELKPDLIIANKEENEKSQIEDLQNEANILVTDVSSLEEAIAMIKDIGTVTGKASEAIKMTMSIQTEFSTLNSMDLKITAAYLIWQKPYMAAGGGTFINDMMAHCGLQNIFSTRNRYPEITLEELEIGNAGSTRCELLLLSSEPYPFKEKHLVEIQKKLPHIKIALADGEMFSWYGSRLKKAPGYFKDFMTQIRNSIPVGR